MDIVKPKEWDELMRPYREKRLLCLGYKRKLFNKLDIIGGLMEAGYSQYEAEHYYNVIEEKKKGTLSEKGGDDE